jgi:hypothetical protein
MESGGDDDGMSERISNEGHLEGGSDYRTQHRRGGGGHLQDDEEEDDEAENGDQVDDNPLHTHHSVLLDLTPTNSRHQVVRFNRIQSNRDS